MPVVVAYVIFLVPTAILAISSRLTLFMDALGSLVESAKPPSCKSSRVSVPLFIAATASVNAGVKRAHVKNHVHVQGDGL